MVKDYQFNAKLNFSTGILFMLSLVISNMYYYGSFFLIHIFDSLLSSVRGPFYFMSIIIRYTFIVTIVTTLRRKNLIGSMNNYHD